MRNGRNFESSQSKNGKVKSRKRGGKEGWCKAGGLDQQLHDKSIRAEQWVRKRSSEGTRQSEEGIDACLPGEAEGQEGRSNEAKSRPDCEPASGGDRRRGLAGPKDHSAEADATLHAASPLLCPAKKGGRHRGKGISEEGGGKGVRSRVRSMVRSF